MTLDRNTLLEAAKVAEEKKDYSMPIQCPDGIEGCCVAHYVSAKRKKTANEIAAELRALAAAQPEVVVVPLEPTKKMIEAGAQRLVRWETGKEKWPDAWSALDVSAARNDAERCWRSMWLSAAGGKS